jgi:hypothetical protein
VWHNAAQIEMKKERDVKVEHYEMMRDFLIDMILFVAHDLCCISRYFSSD